MNEGYLVKWWKDAENGTPPCLETFSEKEIWDRVDKAKENKEIICIFELKTVIYWS